MLGQRSVTAKACCSLLFWLGRATTGHSSVCQDYGDEDADEIMVEDAAGGAGESADEDAEADENEDADGEDE